MAMIPWNKKYTETLAVTIERLRTEHPEYKNSKITYAGRLDPMAEGLLLVLTDEDVHLKDQLLGLDKVYEVDFILGIQTDSYDLLGIVKNISTESINKEFVKNQIQKLTTLSEQFYPPYSSKPFKGKALWQWAREGKIDEITIPKQTIRVDEASCLSSQTIEKEVFQKQVLDAIAQVEGDFRQGEAISSWEKYFDVHNGDYQVYTIRLRVSSGTYVRSLVQEIATALGTYGTTIKINRTQVGDIDI